MVSLEKQRAVGGLNPATASIRVSETTLSPALHPRAMSGSSNVPSALVPFLRAIIVVVRNG